MSNSKEKLIKFIDIFNDKVQEHAQELTDLDQAIGDGDHGINMARGMNAVIEKMPTLADKPMDFILKNVGMVLVSTVGGASGPLYGTAFMKAGAAIAGKDELSSDDVLLMFKAAIDGIQLRGKAEEKEKTMLDALMPATRALEDAIKSGADLSEALQLAEDAANEGVEFTKTIIATKGRATYVGERSIGHQDPGATSTYYLIQSAKEAI